MNAFLYLEKYQNFTSKEEMDDHVSTHINYNKDVLKESTISVLRCIASHCLTYFGATTLKTQTIIKETGFTERTIMRATKLLSEINVIKKFKTTNKKGQGANIFSILPFSKNSNVSDLSAKPCQSQEEEKFTSNIRKSKVEGEKEKSLNKELSTYSLTSFKTSTLNNLYIHAYAHEEFLNEWQLTLIELLNSFKIDKILGEEFNKVIAATEITNAKEFHIAKDIIIKMAKDLQSGRLSVDSTLRAVYKGAHKAKTKRELLVVPEEVKTVTKRTVPFYNWLDEREVVL